MPPLTINKLLPQGQGLSPVLRKRAAYLALDWDTRQKSRFDATDSQGRTLGVFLARGSVLRGGDVLVAEDGSLIEVRAEPQAVLRVMPCAEHGTAFDLVRAAYHLGNRHVQLELTPTHLQLEPDHVLAEMLRQMHLTVVEASAAFEPEAGAYAGSGHAHPPGHAGKGVAPEHGDTHSHAPAEPRVIAIAADANHGRAGHVHGPGCGHDH